MDLVWDIDADALGMNGIAEFTYILPAGVSWAQAEGNIGGGSYRLSEGSLSLSRRAYRSALPATYRRAFT